MPRHKKGTVPSYRHHKARNLAVVTIDGKDFYLGPYGSRESHRRYEALVRSWREREDRPEPDNQPIVVTGRPSINDLILVYLEYAEKHYRPNNGRNSEAGCVDDALKVVQECGYGEELAESFRPKDLKKVREAMIAKDWSRGYVNHQVIRIKRMFAYAVEEDLIPGSVYHGLIAVKGLRKGTPGIRESAKVKPVPFPHIKAVLKVAPRIMRAMLFFAWRTGARPGEICALKPIFLDRSHDVWLYRVPPHANKTDVHDQERTIYLAPKAQKILAPWLEGIGVDEHLFSPVRENLLRQLARAEARQTKPTPSEIRRKKERKMRVPKIRKCDRYSPSSFRQAVARLCEKAGVPAWSPNRLRHNAATLFRKNYGLESARILLGHRKMNTTEIYAEADLESAKQAILGAPKKGDRHAQR